MDHNITFPVKKNIVLSDPLILRLPRYVQCTVLK